MSTSVALFAGATATTPLFTATDVLVGRTDTINGKPIDPPFDKPPLEGAFWGDFGMALKQGKHGKAEPDSPPGSPPTLDSLLAQIAYGPGVTAGYRVHAASEQPWLQLGLGPADLALLPTTFALNPPDPGSPATSPADIPYFNELVVIGSLAVDDGTTAFANDATGLIFDTGAYTTIHNHHHTFPAALRVGDQVNNGAAVVVGAPSLLAGGGMGPVVPFLAFAAGSTFNDDRVSVKDGGSYYLNTGLLPFLHNDLIVNLQGGTLTLAPAAVPGPLPLLGLPVVVGLRRSLRRRRAGHHRR